MGCGDFSNSSSGSGSGSGSGCCSMEKSTVVVDQRKRKRMLSNRDSARRSRQRKQKHLDDLMNQLSQLRKENEQIHATHNMTIQQYHAVESESSLLRTQIMELNSRYHALYEILDYVNTTTACNDNDNNNTDNNNNTSGYASDLFTQQQSMDMIHFWNPFSANNFSMVASEDLFLC
ncbi:Basic-leucine zipper (bZIP) transcription factor family [Zostera marina]|uniref:Basic-leucine zipper (BZIP) transcription factor family n=1 Tax=Zostera marina TaxID=29655 RepID=A0A0K9NMD2_ZOSMR|nr:Basic-leucine zipper (bZIP) transcription factor family [Zostera marina]